MMKRPVWFTLIVVIALLWNLAGVLAVFADMRLSPADIAALPAQQQALYAARPMWSVIASLVAVLGGTLGCLGLLIRKRWAIVMLYASLFGVIVQDIGIFIVAGGAKVSGLVPFILQGIVLAVAIGLVMLTRNAIQNLGYRRQAANPSLKSDPTCTACFHLSSFVLLNFVQLSVAGWAA